MTGRTPPPAATPAAEPGSAVRPARLPRTVVRVEGVKKRFGDLEVLRGVDLEIERGRATAVVGPNGAGKSTLIKMLLGMVKPDAGELWVEGELLNGDPTYRGRIGYMPQMVRFPENLTPREIVRMVEDLREGGAHDRELVKALELEGELDKRMGTLSGGTRQKVNAVVAFLFQPDLLILDEPTAGLDPLASSVFKDKLRAEVERGCSVILTSHIMAEIEELADEVAFLLEGRIRFAGPLARLKAEAGEASLERSIARMMTGARRDGPSVASDAAASEAAGVGEGGA